jgi:hypothetical protein
MRLCNSKEPFEELKQSGQNTLLFLGPVATAETGHRRHNLVDVGAGGFEGAIPEGILDKLPGLFGFELLLGDDGKRSFHIKTASYPR